MKRIKIFFLLGLLALGFGGCEDDNIKAVLKSDVAPNELMAPSSDSYVLTKADKDKVMETFEWTATDFGYDAAVTYTLQIDIAGNEFADAVNVLSTSSLSGDVNVGAFNDLLLSLGIPPEVATEIEIRVVSSVGSNVPVVYSAPQTITVTDYATSFPPIYGMGAALNGWGPWPDSAVEWQSSDYKKYETVAYLKNGKTFRWFAQLDWNPTSYNYPFFTTVDPLFVNAGDGDKNLKVDGASGWYKINVDLSAKTVVATAVSEPVMYMTGAGIGGWDQPGTGASIKMKYIKPGVFTASASFIQTQTWRFFAQADWGPTSYNFPFFKGGVPTYFENAADGDSNFRVVGASGKLSITVDINTQTVTLGDPELYVTGDDFGWGWADGQYVKMTYKGSNTFETTATLTNGKLFRFFPQKDWSPSYNFSYFTTVDSELANQGAGTDENFKYTGPTGSRKITVNMTTKTVSID